MYLFIELFLNYARIAVAAIPALFATAIFLQSKGKLCMNSSRMGLKTPLDFAFLLSVILAQFALYISIIVSVYLIILDIDLKYVESIHFLWGQL